MLLSILAWSPLKKKILNLSGTLLVIKFKEKKSNLSASQLKLSKQKRAIHKLCQNKLQHKKQYDCDFKKGNNSE